MFPRLQIFRCIHRQARENVKGRVDEEVGAVNIDERRVGGKAWNDWVDLESLHGDEKVDDLKWNDAKYGTPSYAQLTWDLLYRYLLLDDGETPTIPVPLAPLLVRLPLGT